MKIKLFVLLAVLITHSLQAGEISPRGLALQRFLIHERVDSLWLPGHYVDWKSGKNIDPSPGEIKRLRLYKTSHCSSYVAAVSMKMGVTMLNPETSPEGNYLLANHQNEWLNSEAGKKAGWNLATEKDAENLANEGKLVIASVENPNHEKSGHIAIVVPDAEITPEQITTQGPTISQAGSPSSPVPNGNSLHTSTVNGFYHHAHGDLKMIQFFYHDIPQKSLVTP